MTYILLGIGIIFSIGLSTFFSLSETALLSLNRYRIRFLIQKHGKKAEVLRDVVDHPESVLSPILLGNTLANVITAMLTSFLVSAIVVRESLFIGNELAQAIASILISMLILIFGEITPKSVAARQPEHFALKVIHPLRWVALILSPLVKISLVSSRGMIRLLSGKRGGAQVHRLSIEELKAILTHHSDSALTSDALEMIHKLFEFPSIPVRDIMVPRNLVVMVDTQTSLRDLKTIFLRYEFSNIPVFQDSPDNVMGIISVRDFFREILRMGPQATQFKLETLIQPATFVPEAAPISEVLRHFKESRHHFAMVVDEFGQFEGIVTLEDVLEEIVGEIQDQGDKDKISIHKIAPGTYLLDGLLPVRDFNRFFSRPLPLSEAYSTLAGFLMAVTGKLPQPGDQINWENYRFTIEELDGHKIKLVRLIIPERRPETPRR